MVGQKIKHYRIRNLIGRGAMGTVYRAHDEVLDRDVALKVLSTQAVSTQKAMERFYREARAVAGLSHPNFVAIHEIGEHEGTSRWPWRA